jgi:LmeA-like phospholipid-binding/Dolichyl-phosphate-mannose-protein mannosyltransferase
VSDPGGSAPPPGRATTLNGARRRARGAVLLGFAVLAATAVAWLSLDRHPPEWDHANHLEQAVRCANGIRTADWDAILGHSPFYPPLALCAAGLFYLALPTDVAAAGLVMIAALGLGMFATYLLARPLVGEGGAAVAALLYGTAPYAVFSVLRLQLDLPLAAMVALALVVMRESDGLRHLGWALLTGVVLALGMLTKPPFGLYVAPALLWLLRGMRSRRGAVHGLLMLGVSAVLALPWYGPRLLGLPSQFAWRAVSADETVHLDPHTVAALLRYPAWFPIQFGVAATALFLLGLALVIRRRAWWLLGSLVGPLIILEMLRNKNLRYTLPLLPLAAVVAAVGWRALPGAARAAAAVCLAVVAAVQVGVTAFDWPRGARLPGTGMALGIPSPPERADWRHREILALLDADSQGRPATVSVVPNHALFSVANFRYYALRDGRAALEFSRAWDGAPLGIDYVILKTGDVGPPWTEGRIRRVTASLEGPASLARVFPVIGRFALPDGSEATVRARRLTEVPGLAAPDVAGAAEGALRRWISDFAREIEAPVLRLQYDDAARQGRFARVEVTADGVTFAEFRRPRAAQLRMRDVRIVLEEVVINPFGAVIDGQLEPLDAGRLRLERATIMADDLQRFLAQLPKLRTRVTLEPGALAVTVHQFGPDVRGRVRLVPVAAPLPLALVPEDVRIGPVLLPDALVGWVMRQYDPTGRIARRLAMPITIGRIAVDPASITISSD